MESAMRFLALAQLVILAHGNAAGEQAFVTGFEATKLGDWSISLSDESAAGAVKIEAMDGGEAFKLKGVEVPELEGKSNETMVRIDKKEGPAILRLQGPVSSTQKNYVRNTNQLIDITFHRHSLLAELPEIRADTFVLEVDIKGAGGIRFGGGHKVYIGKVGDIGRLMAQAPRQRERSIGRRFFTLDMLNRIKVICTPSFIRVYRENSQVAEILINPKQDWPRIGIQSGPIALFGRDVSFRNLRVSMVPSSLEASVVVSAPPENITPEAYAFSAEKDVTVDFGVLNYGGSTVQFGLALDEFSKVTRREVGTRQVPGASTAPKRLSFNLGRTRPGFYQMHLTFSADGKSSDTKTWPLAVLRSMGGRKEDFTRPLLTMAPYLGEMGYLRHRRPFYANTYVHKIADDLRHYGFNGAIGGMLKSEHLDLFQRYGLAVWDRGVPRNHPVVPGALIGDEAHPPQLKEYMEWYAASRKKRVDPTQLLITSQIGEGISQCVSDWFWDKVRSRMRYVRLFGTSGSSGVNDNLRISYGRMSYPGTLRNIRNYGGKTPFMINIPVYGGIGADAAYRSPTSAEVKVKMHLSAAYGARGFFFYSLQDKGDGPAAMVDKHALRPMDPKIVAVSAVARKLLAHDRLITSLEPEARRVYSTHPFVEVVALESGKKDYVYVVNRNVHSETDMELFWDPERKIARVDDLYAGESLPVFRAPFEKDGTSSRIRLALLPGEGKLLAINGGR